MAPHCQRTRKFTDSKQTSNSASPSRKEESGATSGETRVRSVHWTSKLNGKDAKDELRYMNAGAFRELVQNLPWEVQKVLRDRDNVTLVGDVAMIVTFLAKERGWSEEETEERLFKLVTILPAMIEVKGRLAKVGVSRLAELCDDIPGVAVRLLGLKEMFPACDVGTMVSKCPFMLTESLETIEGGLNTLRELFPLAGENGTPGVDRMAQAVPQLLDAEFARGAMEELCRLYGPSAHKMVHRNPMLVLQVESAALRSRYSTSFDQTHVRANRIIPLDERIDEPYYRT